MVTTKAPVGRVEISDPNNVAETMVNGPFNIMRMGAMISFTYTVVRPDTTAIFAGDANPTYKGTVAARITMPTQMAEELLRTLGQTLGADAPVAGRA
jgi:hypothetical protein